MFELEAGNAVAYLSSRHGFDGSRLRVTALGGGVSNTVLLVETPGLQLVLKQSLAKLRVEQDWFSDRERIFRECAAMRTLAPRLPAGSVPEILFEDRENFLFAMSAAPPGAETWKSLLMRGVARLETAERIGRMLSAMIAGSWSNPEFEAGFGDQTVFDQLRLDPYYRVTGRRHPDLAEFFERLAGEYGARRVSLVHGDWSPKNFLVDGGSVTAIDFEVIHFGDPSFDAAFFLNHLLLKSFHLPQWRAGYARLAERFWSAATEGLPAKAAWFESSALRHLGGLLLARIDGKSPAEYIRDEATRDKVRAFARRLILKPPDTVREVFQRLEP